MAALDYASDTTTNGQPVGSLDAFGPVRGDLGPTLFTHVLREIFDPRRSLELPGKAVTAQATLRGCGSIRQGRSSARVRDPSGDSGDDVGWQFDARLVWRPALLDLDGACLAGAPFRRAPTASGQDPAYGCFSVTHTSQRRF